MRGDPVRTQMIDEILENVHHVGGNVVKGDCIVAAAVRSHFGRVVNITPIPHVLGNVTGNEVMFGAESMK